MSLYLGKTSKHGYELGTNKSAWTKADGFKGRNFKLGPKNIDAISNTLIHLQEGECIPVKISELYPGPAKNRIRKGKQNG